MSPTIELPEGLLAGVFHVPEPEIPRQVLIELACALYARRALTHAQPAAFAGLDRFGLGEELARREIPSHYSEEYLAADFTYGHLADDGALRDCICTINEQNAHFHKFDVL